MKKEITRAFLTPGKTVTLIGDPSVLRDKRTGVRKLRFSVLLGIGFDEGPRYMCMEGCLAWRNRFGQIEWTPGTHREGSRHYLNGWTSPLTNREVAAIIENKYGHKIDAPQKRRAAPNTIEYLDSAGNVVDSVGVSAPAQLPMIEAPKEEIIFEEEKVDGAA